MGCCCPPKATLTDDEEQRPLQGDKLAAEAVTAYVSGQHTVEAWKKFQEWIGQANTYKLMDNNYSDVRYSGPGFNIVALPDGSVTFPAGCRKYDVPCYGPILDEVMALFAIEAVRQCAADMKIKIPEYKVDTFIKGKMKKVREMCDVAGARSDCTGQNVAAVAALKKFADAFESVNEKDITCIADWKRFVGQHVKVSDWQEKLSFNDVLQNFGFDSTFASTLRSVSFEITDSKTGAKKSTKWEDEGVRWVSKALGGFKPVGCLVDVVNLVFAMMSIDNVEDLKKASDAEARIRKVLRDFCSKVENKAVGGLWIPTHFLHDCESDDMLAWCVLAYIQKLAATDIKVMAQLPTGTDADRVETILNTRLKVDRVFRDSASRNIDPIKQYWQSIDS